MPSLAWEASEGAAGGNGDHDPHEAAKRHRSDRPGRERAAQGNVDTERDKRNERCRSDGR
jgi:hypothetical protein